MLAVLRLATLKTFLDTASLVVAERFVACWDGAWRGGDRRSIVKQRTHACSGSMTGVQDRS
jgi:hypothetical protein